MIVTDQTHSPTPRFEWHHAAMSPSSDGAFVMFHDYEALIERNRKLVKQHEGDTLRIEGQRQIILRHEEAIGKAIPILRDAFDHAHHQARVWGR